MGYSGMIWDYKANNYYHIWSYLWDHKGIMGTKMVHCGTSWTNVEAKNVKCDDAHHRGDTSLASNDMVNSQDSQLHVLWYIPNWCSENVPKS